MLHPAQPARKPYVQQLLEKETGPFIAVSDYMKIVPDQIAESGPGGLTTLGTDGFGRSETRRNLRRFFEIDAESTVLATLHALGGAPVPSSVAPEHDHLGQHLDKPADRHDSRGQREISIPRLGLRLIPHWFGGIPRMAFLIPAWGIGAITKWSC